MSIKDKKIKILLISIPIIILGYYGFWAAYVFHYSYRTKFEYKPCFWIFTDSAQKDVDKFCAGGSVRKTDSIYTYIYKDKYFIEVWGIKALSDIDLKRIQFRQGLHLADVKFFTFQTLDAGSFCETTVNLGPFFKDTFNVDLDAGSKINKVIENENYRGFYGTVKKMAFENEEGDFLAFVDYPARPWETLFLMYKSNDSFYIIIVNAKVHFDESIIDIFNLKKK